MAKKKKTKIEQPVESLEAQVIEEQADEIKEENKKEENVIEEKPKRAPRKTSKEKKTPKVAEVKTGKIIRIFSNGTAMVEVDGVQSLISLGNANRCKVGEIVRLQFKYNGAFICAFMGYGATEAHIKILGSSPEYPFNYYYYLFFRRQFFTMEVENYMKYYSENLKQLFETQEECEKAETEALEAKKRAETERDKLLAERKVRAKEIEEARKVMQEAQNKYNKLLREFLRDYKTYHYSTNSIEDIPRIFDWFTW